MDEWEVNEIRVDDCRRRVMRKASEGNALGSWAGLFRKADNTHV